MDQNNRAGWTRREALGMLGMGATALAWPSAAAAAPTFPSGAVIRTVLRDYAPDELAGGATLFHEHMSFAPDFMPRWTRAAAETRVANGLPMPTAGAAAATPAVPPAPAASTPFFMQDLDLMSDEMAIARREGIACIVDGGHPDMGRDMAFLKDELRKATDR